jgi:endonuclease G, mitochondrial
MLKQDAADLVRTRIRNEKDNMARVRADVRAGRWYEADLDIDRRAKFFTRRILKRTPRGAESARGPSVDFQSCAFLVEGADVRRAVGYVEVNDPREFNQGSGFLISPRLFITNQHVISDADAARTAVISFSKELDKDRRPLEISTFRLDPDTFAEFSKEDDLDFAVIAIGERLSGPLSLEELGYCPLSDRDDKHVEGMALNIIQHPKGWSKMVTVRNNLLVRRTSTTLLYDTDTEVGSSGAPVFNDDWDVVALHHYGEPYRALVPEEGGEVPREVNEGIRASRIVADLKRRLDSLPPARRALLDDALRLGANGPVAGTAGRVMSPPRPRAPQVVTNLETRAEKNAMQKSPGIVRITIEIDAGAGQVAFADTMRGTAPAAPPGLLRPAAEARRLDRNYGNRGGYKVNFIPGFAVPLPTESQDVRNDIAPLRATEADATEGLLKYQNFSMKLSKSKRIAIYSATNIHGRTYLHVDRDSGRVSNESEGETWYKDPRISETFYLGQSFYSDWSHYFDRGHLTRRTDPTWGTAEQAERANADTFHFTNCSPQHFRFNQTVTYWQGLERYVLENGFLDEEAENPERRISVFQGPIFDDAIDNWCDDVQIPSSYWKLVLWVSASHGRRAVALIADQGPLLHETRVNLGPPRDVPSVDVSGWRVPVREIEERTGLQFSPDVSEADTIQLGRAPSTGEERAAIRRVLKWEDLLR